MSALFLSAISDRLRPFKVAEKLSASLLLLLLAFLIYLGRTQLGEQLVLWGINALITVAVGLLIVLLYILRRRYEENLKELAKREMELDIAKEVQTELFPKEIPRVPNLDLSAVCIPARGISGDYYDFLKFHEKKYGVVVADVSGKGISAALLMANLQALLKSQFHLHDSTAELCRKLNGQLLLSSGEGRYATLFYGLYCAEDEQLYYVNAGHVPPLLFKHNGIAKLMEGGIPIGLLPEAEYTEGRMPIDDGDLLMIYSDGLSEARNGSEEEYGEQRLMDLVSRNKHMSVGQLQELVLADVRAWCGNQHLEDDATLVMAKINLSNVECRISEVEGTA
jgi:sigma-B regulation protein RsbU (phosphoserine phosphatase)